MIFVRIVVRYVLCSLLLLIRVCGCIFVILVVLVVRFEIVSV